jgi:hypothetical protein
MSLGAKIVGRVSDVFARNSMELLANGAYIDGIVGNEHSGAGA